MFKIFKKDVLDIINADVVNFLKEQVQLPENEHIYLELYHHSGRTYEICIMTNYRSTNNNFIIHDNIFKIRPDYNNSLICLKGSTAYIKTIKEISGFPKVVFEKQIHNFESIILTEEQKNLLKQAYDLSVENLNDLKLFEDKLNSIDNEKYNITIDNNLATVLCKNHYGLWEKVLDKESHFYNLELVLAKADKIMSKINNRLLCLDYINSNECKANIQSFSELNNCKLEYKIDESFLNILYEVPGVKIQHKLYYEELSNFKTSLNGILQDFINESKIKQQQNILLKEFFNDINNCKNGIWMIEKIDNNYLLHLYHKNKKGKILRDFSGKIFFYDKITNEELKNIIYEEMKHLLRTAENNGIRVLEVIE